MGLSSLVVHLKSNYADFTRGLERSAAEARRFGKTNRLSIGQSLAASATDADRLTRSIKKVSDGGSLVQVARNAKRLRETLQMTRTSVKLLTLPLVAIRNPAAGAVMAFDLFDSALKRTRRGIRATVSGMFRLARAMGRTVVSGARKAASGLAMLAGPIKLAGAALATIGAAGVGFGVKLAAEAETAHTSFTTMLGSATEATAVLAQLKQFSASTPFQLDSLRDGAKLLLNAQVPTNQLIDRMTMLGDVAAGTGKPIIEFARIYSKVKATGKVSLETLNQLAERGVPIYSELTKVLGVSREEMLKMISRGKVGFDDLHSAISATTSAGGIFAGGMVAQSQTLSGLWSTLKDNVGFALQEIAEQLLTAFNFKEVMSRTITFVQGLKERIVSIAPVIQQFAATVSSYFTMLWEVGSAVWTAISDAAGVTGGNIMQAIVTGLAAAEYAFTNWQQIAELALTGTKLGVVRFGNELIFTFTDRIPSVLTWFADNWRGIFRDVLNFTATVFSNLADNVINAMSAIWDFIASGGTASLNLTWKPLTDGFVAALKELPNIPKREMGPLEAALQQEFDALSKATGDGLGEHIANRLQELEGFQKKLAETKGIVAPNITQGEGEGEDGPDAIKQQTEVKISGAVGQGSQEAYSAIVRAMRENRGQSPELKAAEKGNVIAEDSKELLGELLETLQKAGVPLLPSLG